MNQMIHDLVTSLEHVHIGQSLLTFQLRDTFWTGSTDIGFDLDEWPDIFHPEDIDTLSVFGYFDGRIPAKNDNMRCVNIVSMYH